MSKLKYSRSSLAAALRSGGIGSGDTVLVHLDLAALGDAEGAPTTASRNALVREALFEVVGPEGTVLVPTYSFSFCRQEDFDPDTTPAVCGAWNPAVDFPEEFRKLPGAVRSRDPIHSVAGVGPRAAELLENVPGTCFGTGSVFHRLHLAGAKILTLGLGLDEATYRHHVEERVGLPYRFRKLFTGKVKENGTFRKMGWVYYVRILADNATPDGSRLASLAEEEGICRVADVGAGRIRVVTCRDFDDLTERTLRRDPWFTARGPAADPIELEKARVGARPLAVPPLAPDATAKEIVDALWLLPRDIVSDGFDAALSALGAMAPMTVHEYPSGLEAGTWIVPEKWTCHEAYLETLDGRRLFSTEEHALHVVSYSLPFEGVVSREELLGHLHVHRSHPDAVPFVFKYYERDWGLCCSRRLRDSLTDEKYRVVIRTDFSYGTLKVGEVVARGATDRTFILCAHLCHPQQAADDMGGVAVGMKVMQALQRRKDLRFTYKYHILPETIGTVAYLHQNTALVPRMAGGLFLEMLGLSNPHSLQLSMKADTPLDRCLSTALREKDPQGRIGAYRNVVCNDERQYNGPGYRVPMLSLSRLAATATPGYSYPEYHSSLDVASILTEKSLAESVELVLYLIQALEDDVVPLNEYKGEAFCSRYGIFFDQITHTKAHEALFGVMDLIDGTRSVSEIAVARGIPIPTVKATVDELRRHGLVTLLP